MHTITKLGWVTIFRKYLDKLAFFPLPKINPTLVSIASVVAVALIYINPGSRWLVFSFIFLSIILDWLDGLIARRYGLDSRQGYQIDGICDRASELVLSSVFFFPWFYLALVNIFLMYISWRTDIHFVISLRLFFLLFIICQALGFDVGFLNT